MNKRKIEKLVNDLCEQLTDWNTVEPTFNNCMANVCINEEYGIYVVTRQTWYTVLETILKIAVKHNVLVYASPKGNRIWYIFHD